MGGGALCVVSEHLGLTVGLFRGFRSSFAVLGTLRHDVLLTRCMYKSLSTTRSQKIFKESRTRGKLYLESLKAFILKPSIKGSLMKKTGNKKDKSRQKKDWLRSPRNSRKLISPQRLSRTVRIIFDREFRVTFLEIF